MKITVNGESREVEADISVSTLLRTLGIQPEATVVQRNGDIVERVQFDAIALSEGDRLELVRFVGGG